MFSGAAFDFVTNYLFHCSLADVEKRKTQANVNGDQSAWGPYFAFVNKLEERLNDNAQGVLNSIHVNFACLFVSKHCNAFF